MKKKNFKVGTRVIIKKYRELGHTESITHFARAGDRGTIVTVHKEGARVSLDRKCETWWAHRKELKLETKG